MARVRSTEQQREIRLHTVAVLINRGWKHARIAKELDVSVPTIERDVAELKRRWRRGVEEFWLSKSRELADINHQINEAWEAWELSKRNKLKETTENVKAAEGDKGSYERNKLEVSTHAGDPAFLSEIRQLREQRMRLLGLNAPFKVAPVAPDGSSLQLTIDDEQLLSRLRDLRSKILAEQPEVVRISLLSGETTDSGASRESVVSQSETATTTASA